MKYFLYRRRICYNILHNNRISGEKGNKSHSILVYHVGINEISVFVKEKMLGFNA